MRIAYFTAGTHGAGHLMRGKAILAALERQNVAFEFRIFSPENSWNELAGDHLCRVELETDLLRDAQRADTSALAQALRAWRPDLLLLDLFWVPLSLMTLPCPTWLLLRSVPTAWLVGPREARFDAGRYERIFAIEPAPGLEAFESMGPVVYEKRWKPRTRDELCALVSTDSRRPLRLIVQAGVSTDDALLQEAADRQGGGFIRVSPAILTPASPWLRTLRDGDQVIAGAGYNLYWESHYFGFHAHMRFVALPRRIDDQAWRVAGTHAPGLFSVNGADRLASQVVSRFGSIKGEFSQGGTGLE